MRLRKLLASCIAAALLLVSAGARHVRVTQCCECPSRFEGPSNRPRSPKPGVTDSSSTHTDEAADVPQVPPGRTPANAIVGRSLGDFRWIDSGVVPPGAAPDIQNIADRGGGTFAHTLRWRDGWHDGDRSLSGGKYAGKGRAELCCLGGDQPMRVGETWMIGTSLFIPNDFPGARGFVDVGQLVHHQSFLDLDDDKITLRVFEAGLGSSSRSVRRVRAPREEWIDIRVIVKFARDGTYAMSVGGDDFVEKGGFDTTKGHDDSGKHGNTWGLYVKNGRADTTILTSNNFIARLD